MISRNVVAVALMCGALTLGGCATAWGYCFKR